MRVIIGVTGGIATGKTAVMQALSRQGVRGISADALAHRALMPGAPAYRAVLKRYGASIRDSKGKIDRRRLGAIVFARASERRWLERQIHPYVIGQLRKFIARQRGVAAVDIPLLFEAGLQSLVDEIWVVYAPQVAQIRRLLKRNRLTKSQALLRIRAQLSLRSKCQRADYVLRNTKNLAYLNAQVVRRLAHIRNKSS